MHITTSNLVNSIGLTCDIIGAIIIWFYGLPEPISRNGSIFIIAEGTDEKERKKAKRYEKLALFGIITLVIGFLLQLISNFL